LCSYEDKNDVNKLEIPLNEGDDDEERKRCIIKMKKFYEPNKNDNYFNDYNNRQSYYYFLKNNNQEERTLDDDNEEEDIFIINKGFPGPIDEGKAAVRLVNNAAYTVSGEYYIKRKRSTKINIYDLIF